MSARDDYPDLDALVRCADIYAHEELDKALNEIDELRLNLAWADRIAGDRGEENERLRSMLRDVACPNCRHPVNHHDPENGSCDVFSGDLDVGVCRCGREAL